MMTAPFAPPIPRIAWFFIALLVAVTVAAPFVRRDDAVGWIAISVVFVAAVALWGALLWGLGCRLWDRLHRRER